MSLEEDTEEIESPVCREIRMLAQILRGCPKGCIQEDLVRFGIIDALSRHHGWTDDKIKEVYDIEVRWAGLNWDVRVEAK